MKRQQQPRPTLIRASGIFARIPGNASASINENDTITNPVANGFWAVHKMFGTVLCITTGPHKGMWIARR